MTCLNLKYIILVSSAKGWKVKQYQFIKLGKSLKKVMFYKIWRFIKKHKNKFFNHTLVLYVYCTTSVSYNVCLGFCLVKWSELPHLGRGSCLESLPAGRGQSGAQSEAGHSCPPPALNVTATPHWRTLPGQGEAWLIRTCTIMTTIIKSTQWPNIYIWMYTNTYTQIQIYCRVCFHIGGIAYVA